MLTRNGLLLLIAAMMLAAAPVLAQESWWEPAEPQPGDELTIYYDTDPGSLPPGNIKIHWGINSWSEPPQSMWPDGTVVADPGMSVQTPLVWDEGTVWKVTIQTDDTVEQVDYVFTNGTNWDNDNGSDWHIYFGDPPPMTWHRFTLDTRSSNLGYNAGDLGQPVYLKGDMNGWSEENALNGPDQRGVFYYDFHMLDGIPYGYKYNAQGDIWMQDPDNPLLDGSMFNNSLVVAQAKYQPYFYGARPFDGQIVAAGETVELKAKVFPADDSVDGIESASFSVAGLTVENESYNPDTFMLTAEVNPATPGMYTVDLNMEDTNGSSSTASWTFVLASDDYYMVSDQPNDDDGMGDYTPGNGYDLRSLMMEELDGGDVIGFTLETGGIATDTRVLMQISNNITGQPAMTPGLPTEVALPDFAGSGVQIVLAPNGANANFHNRLIVNRDPVEFGYSFTVTPSGDDIIFEIPVAELEAVLGSYNSEWYFAAYSFMEGPGNAYEVTAADGGTDEVYDPDAYDAMFVESHFMQNTLFTNFTSTRPATLDAVGRGFGAVAPDQIGPNVGSAGPSVSWVTRNWETVWPQKLLYAHVDATDASITIHHEWDGGSDSYNLGTQSDDFTYEVDLQPGDNVFQLEAELGGETSVSSELTVFHITQQAPVPEIYSTSGGGTIDLNASNSYDPQDQTVFFQWSADPNNPATVNLSGANTEVASFPVPATPGEYYFDLVLEDTESNQNHARHMVDVHADGFIEHFDTNQTANWVRDAVVYEIYVRSYDDSQSLDAITADLDRIVELGVNTLWFMPIHPGPSTHGYAITDYYGIEEDYGTMEDFEELVDAAHDRDLKIVLDMVINHTAIEHPWMQDAQALGEASNTYDWYDRDANGDYTYYYDWVSLPNLNYGNADLRHYMIEMSKWWIEEMGVDGYRCDVAWGPQQRNPNFWIEWRTALKTIRPEVWLLGEADVSDFTILNDRFDSAYDWNLHHAGSNSFTSLYSNSTPNGLQDRISNYGVPFPDYRFPFRFMENHDEDRYINVVNGNVDKTKTAATMLMTSPGIPLIYAGQEVGETSPRGLIDWDGDEDGYRAHYGKLVEARNRLQALKGDEQYFLNNDQNASVYSYARRWSGEHPVVVALNRINSTLNTTIDFVPGDFEIEPGEDYYLQDILSGSVEQVTGSDLEDINVTLDPFTSAVFVISDTLFVMDAPESSPRSEQPQEFSLEQNYPNPFNPTTQIAFSLPAPGEVELAVYNVMGQEVVRLVDRAMSAGRHVVTFDGYDNGGRALASGVYFYRIEAGDFQAHRKMVLLK